MFLRATALPSHRMQPVPSTGINGERVQAPTGMKASFGRHFPGDFFPLTVRPMLPHELFEAPDHIHRPSLAFPVRLGACGRSLKNKVRALGIPQVAFSRFVHLLTVSTFSYSQGCPPTQPLLFWKWRTPKSDQSKSTCTLHPLAIRNAADRSMFSPNSSGRGFESPPTKPQLLPDDQ